jgi:cell division protein YceG involved in septum cleavage
VQYVFSKRIFLILILAIVVSCGVYLWQLFIIPTPVTEHVFHVEQGDNVHTIAAKLKNEGIIKHRTYYYFTYFIFGTRNPPKPGVYRLSTDMQIREMVYMLQGDPWAKYVTIPAGLSKQKISEILARELNWEEIDKQFFPHTYSGMQWQKYQEDLEEVFSSQFKWNKKESEHFLTLSALYYDEEHDFFRNMYEPGTYEIPIKSSRAQVAGILIDQFSKDKKDNRTTLTRYIDKKAMDRVASLIDEEMIRLPDIVAIPPQDVILKKENGHTYLLFTTSYWNKGRGPLEFVADPKTKDATGDVERKVYQRIYNLDGGYEERLSGTFLWHSPHHHYHYSDFATYDFKSVDVEDQDWEVAMSYKSTFCIRDYNPIDLAHPGASKDSSYKVCGKERQGISPGWADSYYYTYVDQKFDVTEAPKGLYRLTISINPKERFEEITKDNNVGEILLSLDVKENKVEVLEEKQYGI